MKRKFLRGMAMCISSAMVITGYMPALETYAGESNDYETITDADGNPVDLGGMEIIIRDWWSDPDYNYRTNPTTPFEEERAEYVDWAEKTYNFTIKETYISDWGSTPEDYINYVMAGGDDKNYLWVVRSSLEISNAMQMGLMYDLSTLDCLDFSKKLFTSNKVNEQYGYKGSVFAMSAGLPEPGNGLFINKDLLKEAGVDINEIYDAQKNGTWDWNMFTSVMDKVQKDTDGDGVNDIWGFTGNTGGHTRDFVLSNGGALVGKESGVYTNGLNDPKTVEGMEFSKRLLKDYYMPRPIDHATGDIVPWDFYKTEFVNGTVAFCYEGAYAARGTYYFEDADFDIGFVMIPKGPSGSLVDVVSTNPVVIPACYDADKAWKLAFAYYVYYLPFENIQSLTSYTVDERAQNETFSMMTDPEHAIVAYDQMIPGIETGPDLLWNVSEKVDIKSLISTVSPRWSELIDKANATMSSISRDIDNGKKDEGNKNSSTDVKIPDGYVDNSGSPMEIPGKNLDWNNVGEKSYWYEDGIKQGTYYDAKGVVGDGTIRGREICDISLKDESGQDGVWFWLDSVYDGAKAVGKEVWIPYIYQNEDEWDAAEKEKIALESDPGMGELVLKFMNEKKGKWVRYDENGKMLKGWVTIEGELAEKYPNQKGNTYYYDTRTGLMAKGDITIDGVTYHFDEETGVRQ